MTQNRAFCAPVFGLYVAAAPQPLAQGATARCQRHRRAFYRWRVQARHVCALASSGAQRRAGAAVFSLALYRPLPPGVGRSLRAPLLPPPHCGGCQLAWVPVCVRLRLSGSALARSLWAAAGLRACGRAMFSRGSGATVLASRRSRGGAAATDGTEYRAPYTSLAAQC